LRRAAGHGECFAIVCDDPPQPYRGAHILLGGTTMESSKINSWVAVAGFAVLAIGFSLEMIAVHATYAGRGELHSLIVQPEPMIRYLVDRSK